ncbi:hypothetical protein C8F04DRAFT_1064078 [Mycena alexandri]|uniref:Uncharacterized protein n=1 Tax=Mycena alexandri TaxID=1745969 RepID=A0AAD6THT9_9AGAR|nr:hypothetical protein C8F04DRAFT_1064078 [Mycena alexandri]
MPTLAAAEASNAGFAPSYIPVAVFAGGTSGVGHAMAEALARQTKGRAHIVLIGRSAEAAEKIIAGFPKPVDGDEGWAHEFVPCDANSMASVRRVCAGLRSRLKRINFLVMTAAGPRGNSMVETGETDEGLDDHLSMRYFSRYVYSKELLPLLVSAREQGQHAHLMTVLGAGFGVKLASSDLGLVEARRSSIKFLQGVVLSVAALKGMIRGVGYNDGLVAWFAAQHPNIAFTHIHPGQVRTPGAILEAGWLLSPLAWVITRLRHLITVSQDECAQYMLHGLLDADRGLFIRDNHGDIVSAHVFSPDHTARFVDDSPTARKAGVLNGVQMKGYGGSDATVAALMKYTEEVLSEIK